MGQMGGFGRMLGQEHHFLRAAKEQVPYGVERYTTEAKRLYRVLNGHLGKNEYLAGKEYSIADIATQPWAARHEWHQVDLADYPHVKRRSEEHTSELQSLIRLSYAVFCLQKKTTKYAITSMND